MSKLITARARNNKRTAPKSGELKRRLVEYFGEIRGVFKCDQTMSHV